MERIFISLFSCLGVQNVITAIEREVVMAWGSGGLSLVLDDEVTKMETDPCARATIMASYRTSSLKLLGI